MKTKNKYISRPSKLKKFAVKSLYRKIYPTTLNHKIQDDFLTYEGYTKKQLIKDVYRLIDCNKKISFIHKTVIQGNEHIQKEEIFEVNHCNIFALCPVCAEKVSRRRREKHRGEILLLAEKYEYAYMINFTTRNAETFELSYSQLRTAMRKYILMGQMRGVNAKGETVRSHGEASKIKAMAVSIEIKKGKNSKMWHVHGHAIAFCDRRIDYQMYDQEKKLKIIKDYKEINKRNPPPEKLRPAVNNWGTVELIDSDGVLYDHVVPVSKATMEWIEATSGTSSNIKFIPLRGTPEKIYQQCIEVIKYTSKVQSFSRQDIIEILVHRKGKRFFSTYGELYNLNNPRCKDDENILYVEGITGFVWSPKEKKLIPMTKEDVNESARRYENRETIYRAQGTIMKAYYEKEAVLKKIMNECVQNKNGKNWVTYKKMVIKHIDDLESAYNYAKRKIYNNIMKVSYRLPKLFRPTPLQKMYHKKIDHLLEIK